MIISHRYRFIFVKNQKVAGTSIEIFLSEVCGEDDILTPIWPPEGSHRARNFLHKGVRLYNHMTCSQIREIFPKIFDSYFKFCVERNPWDKTVSDFHMKMHRKQCKDFDEYFRIGKFPTDFHRYCEERSQLMADHVIRYEALTDGLIEVFGQLGVPFNGQLRVRAKESQVEKRCYRNYYDETQRQRVAAVFANEIRLFGYSF